jgi:hypothetical protein
MESGHKAMMHRRTNLVEHTAGSGLKMCTSCSQHHETPSLPLWQQHTPSVNFLSVLSCSIVAVSEFYVIVIAFGFI